MSPSETTSLSDTTGFSDTIDMSVDLAGMRLPNPLMTASGCAANGKELHRFFDIAELGAFVTKTVLADPRSGRGTPRMAETPSGMLNSIGLQGPGVNDFAGNDLAWLKSVGGSRTRIYCREHRRRVCRRGRGAACVSGIRHGRRH